MVHPVFFVDYKRENDNKRARSLPFALWPEVVVLRGSPLPPYGMLRDPLIEGGEENCIKIQYRNILIRFP